MKTRWNVSKSWKYVVFRSIFEGRKRGRKSDFFENRDFGSQKKVFFRRFFFWISRFVATRGRTLMICFSKMQKIVDTRENEAKQNWRNAEKCSLWKIFWKVESMQNIEGEPQVRSSRPETVVGVEVCSSSSSSSSSFFFTVTVNRSYSARWHEGHFGPAASRSKNSRFSNC